MIRFEPLCFCTNNVPGNDIVHALDIAKACGFTYVELSAIDGISEQIVAEQVCDEYVAQIKSFLDERELICYAVSGHCSMTDPQQFARLLKKIEFAGKIGARFLNTRCGPKQDWDIFEKNVRQAAEAARRWGVQLNLESYGDIVGPAAEAGTVFDRLQLESIGYNYDTGNNFRFARGQIDMEQDLKHATIVPSALHLKDASLADDWINNEAIGDGQLDIPAILTALEALTPTLPCSLEIPLSFRILCEDLSFDHLFPSDETVISAVTRSVAYLRKYASFFDNQ